MGAGQGCCATPHSAKDCPTPENDLTPNVSSAAVVRPWFREGQKQVRFGFPKDSFATLRRIQEGAGLEVGDQVGGGSWAVGCSEQRKGLVGRHPGLWLQKDWL